MTMRKLIEKLFGWYAQSSCILPKQINKYVGKYKYSFQYKRRYLQNNSQGMNYKA